MPSFSFLLTLALGLAVLPAVADSTPLTLPGPAPLQAGQSRLMVSPNTLSASLTESDTATSAFQVWNGDTPPRDKMLYILSRDVSWLSLSSSSGIVSTDTNTITAVFSSGTLSPGTYSGTITLDAFNAMTGDRVAGAPAIIALTMVITRRTPLNFEKPAVQGIPYVGQTVNTWRGLWQNANSLSFAYQWQMANDKSGNGLVNITNASGALITTTNYTVTANARSKYLRIKVTATDPYPAPLSTTAYSDFTAASRVNAAPDDFCGDGLTDLWLFDASSGTWWVTLAMNSEASVVFGNPDCSALPGDYDGDGKADPAIYEATAGLWSVMMSANGYAVASVQFGGLGYTPVPADFDGDGQTDPAIYDLATGRWSVMMSGNDYRLAFFDLGGAGYDPVSSDYDGDGQSDPAVYQPATGLWLIMLSGSSYATIAYSFGGPDYTPAPGDYDGDGQSDLAVYWAAGNCWWLKSSQTGAVRKESFGTSAGNGVPAQGYYDHDAHCDPATVRISGDFMIWCVQRSNTNLGYRGQSFQFSIDRWRVSW